MGNRGEGMDQNTIHHLAKNQVNNQKWQEYMQHISDTAAKAGKAAHVTFELTAMCTLKCKMCYVRMEQEKIEQIGPMRTAEEWIDMARQFRDAGGLTILLTGGEAMMRPDFLEIYEAISKMGLFVTVFTNGTTITDEVVEMFTQRPPSLIGLTLYGASEETYERVSGWGGGLKKAVEGMDRLLAIPNLNIDIRFTACSLNYMDYEKTQELVAERGRILGYDIGDAAAVRGAVSEARALRLNDEQRKELSRHLIRASAPILDAIYKNEVEQVAEEGSVLEKKGRLQQRGSEQNMENETDFLEERRLHCRAAAFGVYIAYDGRMYPCDMMSEPYTYPFQDGFVSAYQALREKVKEVLVPEKCMRCKNREKCGPCAAKLIAELEACKREGISCDFTPM